jgi:acetyl-CoA acetyltransferase family protein
MPSEWTVPLGEGAEILADRFNITREEQDEFALRSHRLALDAWGAGAFDEEIAAVPGVDLVRDESIRVTSRDNLASLRPVFRVDGTVTAGNASPMNDGASALLLVDDEGLRELEATPLARIAGRAVSAVEPQLYGLGPIEATERALKRSNASWDDLVVVEINEAFAAQTLACLRGLPELDPLIVNPTGGAIAIGHPLGASGARLLTTLAWQLHKRGGGFGLATMCIGVGQGIAVVLEAA